MLRLRVHYQAPDDLVAEHEAQMKKGGLLVRCEPPPGLELFTPIELEITADFAPGVILAGQVVQVVAGIGVAVAFDPAPVAAMLSRQRAAPAKNEIAAKIQTALHGNKDERGRIIRDNNKMLHPYVLKNPNLGVDEVLAIAKMTTIAPDVLEQIAGRPEWSKRPEIALALVRNPKTPSTTAVRLLDFVSPADLRQLAKGTGVAGAVQAAARKKVLG